MIDPTSSGIVSPLTVKEIDLHELTLYDAEFTICESIEEAWYRGETALLFIHGYHGGSAISDFIRKPEGLRRKISRDYPEIPKVSIRPGDAGSTYLIFSSNKIDPH